MIKLDVYVKEDQSALADDCKRFIYEVSTFVRYENIYNMANHNLFTSEKEIPNIVRSFQMTSYIEVQCELYAAPKEWLLENGFILYVKPEKKKRTLKIKTNDIKKVEPIELTYRRSIG